jgi:hypothetical protein
MTNNPIEDNFLEEKFVSIRTFMDSTDEKSFSEAILKIHPDVIFVQDYVREIYNPQFFKLINQAGEPNANSRRNEISILSTNIVSVKSYLNPNPYIRNQDGSYTHFGVPADAGIVTLDRSLLADYEPGGLRNGTLGADIHPRFGIEKQQFVESIFSILKNGSRRIFVFDPETGVVDTDREENMFFAWPSAIKNYDQIDGKYLTHNKWCYFTSKT